jgi:hypothetical protein
MIENLILPGERNRGEEEAGGSQAGVKRSVHI